MDSEPENEERSHDGSEDDFSPSEVQNEPRRKSKSAKASDAKSKSQSQEKKIPAKKSTADHANYRKLKIKNQNTKGKQGRWGSRR
jgi:DNA replication and checkpoint protein